jgi:hypothetical protein
MKILKKSISSITLIVTLISMIRTVSVEEKKYERMH